MTTHVVEDRQEQRSRNERAARRRATRARLLLVAGTAVVAAAVGVAGTLLFQGSTAQDASAVDAQAAGLARDLRADLNTGFYAPGNTYGGQFTEGTLVAQAERHGGVLLNALPAAQGQGARTLEVMLGLVPPAGERVAAGAYPVRCYRYTFSAGASSVTESGLTCPTSRTDGTPGSLAAQLGALLAAQPAGRSAYEQAPTKGYAHTTQGAVAFLKAKHLVGARDVLTAVAGTPADGDAYAVALRINGVCHYLRMDPSASASRLIPLWAAPADEQQPCDTVHAAAATALYGIDPSKAG